MKTIWIIAFLVFILSTLLIWMTTKSYFKKEYGTKMWKNWTAQTYYWQSAIYLSTGLTILILLFLQWIDIVKF